MNLKYYELEKFIRTVKNRNDLLDWLNANSELKTSRCTWRYENYAVGWYMLSSIKGSNLEYISIIPRDFIQNSLNFIMERTIYLKFEHTSTVQDDAFNDVSPLIRRPRRI